MILSDSDLREIQAEYVELLTDNLLTALPQGHFDSLLKELTPQIIELMLFSDGIVGFDLRRSKNFENASKELWDALERLVPNRASELVLQTVKKQVKDKPRLVTTDFFFCGLPNITSSGAFNVFDQQPVEPKTIRIVNHE